MEATFTWVGFGVLGEAVAALILVPLAVLFFLVMTILVTRFAHHIISPRHRYDDVYDDRPVGSFCVVVVGIFAALYLLGWFNVVAFVIANVLTALAIIGAYLGCGLVYMAVKGIVKLVKARYEKDAALEEAVNDFLAENKTATEDEIATFVKEHEAAQTIEVAKHKGAMTAWFFLWAPDLLYVTVFQFIDRLQDAWNLFWAAFKGVFQSVANSIIGDPAERLLKKRAAGAAKTEDNSDTPGEA